MIKKIFLKKRTGLPIGLPLLYDFFVRHDFEHCKFGNVCFEMFFAMILEHQCSRATTSWETQEWFIFGHPSRSSPGTQGSGSCENQLFASCQIVDMCWGFTLLAKGRNSPSPTRTCAVHAPPDYFACSVRRAVA